jgi:DNA-binding response OmpR family regulator
MEGEMPNVISIGTDEVLLATRERLLQSAGFKVLSITPADERLPQVLAQGADLVIICHSVVDKSLAEVLRQVKCAGARFIYMDAKTPYHPQTFLEQVLRRSRRPFLATGDAKRLRA